MTPFGIELRRLREERGINQKGLARLLGVPERLLSEVETGRRRPDALGDLGGVVEILDLSEFESRQLRESARLSSFSLTISREASPREIRAMNRLNLLLGRLTPKEISKLDQVIDEIGTRKAMSGKLQEDTMPT